MSKQTEAQQLAAYFRLFKNSGHIWHNGQPLHLATADELCRLDEENTEQSRLLGMSAERELRLRAINAQLLEALKTLRDNSSLSWHQLEIILPAINAAKEST